MLKCANCGLEKPDVCERADPFLADVFGEIVMVVVCDDCAGLMSDEI